MKRTYENALKLLESRRRAARPKTRITLSALNRGAAPSPSTQTLRGVPSLVGMKEWLEALGHSASDINALNIIHIAGTKGKGSTCAFTRSFLHEHKLRTGFPEKIGLYTGPDLQFIRERIQIDNEPITEDLFTRYFFEVWERLSPSDLGSSAEGIRQPRYLQLLALLAFHTFIREKVQAAIFETHHGGEFDATNVIPKPVVTGITSLGMDHVAQLGPTIENIAWHKAGIFKPEVPAFSAPQDQEAAEVMRRRADEKKVPLQFVSINKSLPEDRGVLAVPVQRINCSLALEIARCFLQAKAPECVVDDDLIREGVRNFYWPGRFETIQEGEIQWFLDGAHNTLSLKQAAQWFAHNTTASGTERCRVLIFSHYSEERDGVPLVEEIGRGLIENNSRPDIVIFTTYNERKDGTTRIDKTLKVPETPFPDLRTVYATLWKQLDPQATVFKEQTIEEALRLARKVGAEKRGLQVLVTGSLHLVGGALNILRP